MVSRALVLLLVLACVSLPFALAEGYGEDGYSEEEQYSDEQYSEEEPEHYSSGCSSYGYAQAAAEVWCLHGRLLYTWL